MDSFKFGYQILPLHLLKTEINLNVHFEFHRKKSAYPLQISFLRPLMKIVIGYSERQKKAVSKLCRGNSKALSC
jgi:hypothetical protein